MERPQLDVTKATDAEIEAFIESIHQAGVRINFNIRLTQETFDEFFAGFKCQHCGVCCAGLPNSKPPVGILLRPEEVVSLAAEKRVSSKKFKEAYTFTVTGRRERFMKYPCPFFSADKQHHCSIYARRPAVCHYFPLAGMLRGNVYIMEIDSDCPEARRVACGIARQIRDSKRNLLTT
jgi:Fe-S-cluster containining protein